MIDFQNASFVKLKPVSDNDFAGMISPMFVPGEQIIQSFRGIRDGVVLVDTKISSVQRGKDNVKEVKKGYECGVTLEKYDDFKEHDIIEVYELQEVKRG